MIFEFFMAVLKRTSSCLLVNINDIFKALAAYTCMV
jgi:hypothetical protein